MLLARELTSALALAEIEVTQLPEQEGYFISLIFVALRLGRAHSVSRRSHNTLSTYLEDWFRPADTCLPTTVYIGRVVS